VTNSDLARHLRDLHAFLVIAGYDEMHARRYLHLSSEIDSMGEEVEQLAVEGRLREIPGVGPSVAEYIKEILATGKSSKQAEWEKGVPWSVVELLRIPGLGLKTAAKLVHQYRIHSLDDLRTALDNGMLTSAPGIGNKTLQTWRDRLTSLESSRPG